MRIFNIFCVRYLQQRSGTRTRWGACYLADNDSWVGRYFDELKPSYR